jgi:hypothetical protein
MFPGQVHDLNSSVSNNCGTHTIINNKSTINNNCLIDAPYQDSSILFSNNDNEDNTNPDSRDTTDDQTSINLDKFPSIIEIIKGTMLYNTEENSSSQNNTNTFHSLSDAAKDAKLDTNQYIAFQIICCTFMLDWLEELYMKNQHRLACGMISSGLGHESSQQYEKAIELLIHHGAKKGLFMFLSGAGGSGKAILYTQLENFVQSSAVLVVYLLKRIPFILLHVVGQQQHYWGGVLYIQQQDLIKRSLMTKFVVTGPLLRY